MRIPTGEGTLGISSQEDSFVSYCGTSKEKRRGSDLLSSYSLHRKKPWG